MPTLPASPPEIAAEIAPEVPPEFRPDVIIHDEIASTNAEAMRLAASGASGPTWIVARRQTAGRGRAGRGWASEPGNLYASLMTRVDCDVSTAQQVSLLAGVAAFDAIAAAVGPAATIPGLRLKWPNDVLIGRAKLAGILPESMVAADGHLRIVVGIGLNLASHPSDLGREATHLGEHSLDMAPESMLRHVAWSMQHWLAAWNSGAGFGLVREAWLERAGRIGEPVAVNTEGGRRDGRFSGLDADGAMLLSQADGNLERVTFGDVALLAQATDEGRG